MISNEKEFWTVGYSEWGRWQVRKASVDDPYKYTLVEDLGPELHTAVIEADGDFTAPATLNHFELDTEEAPWLGVITTSKKLYVKRVALHNTPNLDTAYLLSQNVEEVSLCRTWRSTFWGVDAGVVCAYRKTNGDVCIRCYRLVNDERVWDDEQLIQSNCTHVQVIRLNDYRIGIYTEPGHTLHISERYYIGGTARTEYIYPDMEVDFYVFSSPRIDEPNAVFKVESIIIVNQYLVKIVGNFPFYSRDISWSGEVVCESGNTVSDYYIQDGFLFIQVQNPINTGLGYLRFRFNEMNRIRFERTPQSRPIVPAITFERNEPIKLADEIVLASITTAATFHSVMRNDYKSSVTEIVDTSIQTAAAFNSVEVQTLRKGVTETILADMSTAASFATTMSGDIPV